MRAISLSWHLVTNQELIPTCMQIEVSKIRFTHAHALVRWILQHTHTQTLTTKGTSTTMVKKVIHFPLWDGFYALWVDLQTRTLCTKDVDWDRSKKLPKQLEQTGSKNITKHKHTHPTEERSRSALRSSFQPGHHLPVPSLRERVDPV